jgi:hypothetical protein
MVSHVTVLVHLPHAIYKFVISRRTLCNMFQKGRMSSLVGIWTPTGGVFDGIYFVSYYTKHNMDE